MIKKGDLAADCSEPNANSIFRSEVAFLSLSSVIGSNNSTAEKDSST
jgi:hypothetical protein